jgi:hypothetical protein
MKTILSGVALALICSAPAFADFYIIQEPTTKRCRIVEERPGPGIGVVIGNGFGVRVEAENHLRTVEVCREGTSGRGGAVIEERGRGGVVIDGR